MKLWKKLKAAREKFPAIEKRGRNPFYKTGHHPDGSPYILYDDIVKNIKPALLSEGLDFRHSSRETSTHYWVGTYLIDLETGERTEAFEMPLAYDGNPQKQSAGITYAKRVTVVSVLELAGDEDNDGNETVGDKREEQTRPAGASPSAAHPKNHEQGNYRSDRTPHPSQHGDSAKSEAPFRADPPPAKKRWVSEYKRPSGEKANDLISEKQAKAFYYVLRDSGWTDNEAHELMARKFGVQHKAELTKGMFWDMQDIMMNHSHKEMFPVQEVEYAPPPPTDQDNPWGQPLNTDDMPF